MNETKSSQNMSPKLTKVAKLAQENPKLRMRGLCDLLDEQALTRAYHRLRRDAAIGVDGIGKEKYGEQLKANIHVLCERMKAGSYRHQPIRRALIPKSSGKLRPLGISSTEDKVVQGALTEVLNTIYEPVFLKCSYGYRPGRSAHDAIGELYRMAYSGEARWILEADIEAYFDNINREQLMEMLRKRIDDKRFLRFIGKCLHVGILDGQDYTEPDVGTTQGSVISPVLGNVYLHYALDEWFENEVRPRLRGRATLVRFADDLVIGFERGDDAERVMQVLAKRLQRFGLKLSEQKTRMVPFRRPKRDFPSGKGPATFDFLGFTWHWGRESRGGWKLSIKTRSSRMRSAYLSITDWCRGQRHRPVKEQHLGLVSRLRGHFNYFALGGNSRCVWRLVFWAARLWHKWLNKRSQRSKMVWPRFQQLLRAYPLPKPKLKPILLSTIS